ncbi:hypothetical protein EMCRGX_G002236 [Ephydatia muelleri]
MPQCCRCNSYGYCKGCECVKKNKSCSSCTPGRNGLESIALKAITVASRLLLQKPFRTSKAKDHTFCLERHLTSWKEGAVFSHSQRKSHLRTHSSPVLDVLISKHPPSQTANPDTITNVNHSNVTHSVIFDGIDASAITSAVLQTEGSAGPSGIDAKGWRRLCTSFHSASV